MHVYVRSVLISNTDVDIKFSAHGAFLE